MGEGLYFFRKSEIIWVRVILSVEGVGLGRLYNLL